MQKIYKQCITFFFLVAFVISNFGFANAQTDSPAQVAETIRSSLIDAQLSLISDPQESFALVTDAQTAYQNGLSSWFEKFDSDSHLKIQVAFEELMNSIANNDIVSFASYRAQVWTGILSASYQIVETSIQNGDGETAQTWLPLREFRIATRFSRPNITATVSIESFIKGELTVEDTLLSIRADLLDTYQARLNEALRDLATADSNGFASRRAELASLANGYFNILSNAYLEQRGQAEFTKTQTTFDELVISAIQNPNELNEKIIAVESAIDNFRAAPLSPQEQTRRAGQLMRFLSLVPVEYGRGVTDGRVTKDLEIQEAITFHAGAYAAFTDLKGLLSEIDSEQTQQVDAIFESVGSQLADAGTGKKVVSAEAVKSQTDELKNLLGALIPETWLQQSAAADFDVIESMLDQMQNAVRNGEYELAESTRLDAYAIMETGPEAKLMVFAPQLKLTLEELFWNGQGEYKGLAYLIKNDAPYSEIKNTRLQLDSALKEAQEVIGKNTAPAAIATNAGIIVFREGLEAVVILASLMSSLKSAEEKKYRKPMWVGVVLALIVTGLTWMLANEVLQSLSRYGEKLEAVVSVIAIIVLLLIMNWFFHNTYWTNWMANFHSQKRKLLSKETGLWLGLMTLGFTSVYREGFEIVLFMQALVLEGGVGIVLLGVLISLVAVIAIGWVVFYLHKSLPYMKILIITGILMGTVLLQMVGSTVHIMQVVGWLPIHIVQGLNLPYWLGTWFGTYPTWEGFSFQFTSATFVIGSYYLAEGMRKKRISSSQRPQAKTTPEHAS
jgi:high-affinity iron transporter